VCSPLGGFVGFQRECKRRTRTEYYWTCSKQIWQPLWVDEWVWQYKRLPCATAEELHCAGREERVAVAMVVFPHGRHQFDLHHRLHPLCLTQGAGVQLQDLQVNLFLLHKL